MKLRKLPRLQIATVLGVAMVFANSAFAYSDATPSPTPGLMTKTLQFLHIEHAAKPAAEATPTPTPGPGVMTKTLQFLHIEHAEKGKQPANIHGDIELKLAIEPSDIQLSTTRQVQVTVGLYNRSARDYIHLNFPTTQRIEALVKDSTGKVVNTWSEDQSFTNDPATVTVNPGERLEYTASVATREMTPGQPFIIEVSLPSYPDLKIQQLVTARR